MLRRLLGGCCLALNFGGGAVAAEVTPEIIVTATRTPIAANRVAAATTVLTRVDIDRQHAQTLPDLLRGVAGIDIAESGGFGKTTSLFLRGTEADHVLVLVDGIRVGSASVGLTAFELLPVEQIERIEIVRGPRASRWGSEAIGGVIQIFTRRGAGDPAVGLDAGGGSFDTYSLAANTDGEIEATHYSISGAYFTSEGIDARQPVPGPFGFDQPDADGYNNASLQASVGHRFSGANEVEGFLLRASGTTQFDSVFEDETDFVQQVVGVAAVLSPHALWTIRLRAGESRDETDNFAPQGDLSSSFNTKRQEASWLNELWLASGQQITMGFDFRDETVESSADFVTSNRDNYGAFVQYLGTLGAHTLDASVRYDENETFAGETTGGIGWGYRMAAGMRLYASYGTAFKSPSFNELFFPGFGNPGLDAEKSASVEAGIEGYPDWGFWSARIYHTDVEALIVTTLDPETGDFFPDNVDDARITGLEMELRTHLDAWELQVSASLLDPEDRATGNRLPRRARETLSLHGWHHWELTSLGGRLLAQGDRFDDLANAVRVDGYATMDLLGEFRWTDRLALRARIGNLFDKTYQTVASFNAPGRHFFLSLHYRGR